MQITIKDKQYGFIWGTKCLIEVQKQLGYNINTFLGSISNPEVSTVVFYHGINLWCSRNNIDKPFESYDDFIYEYDEIFPLEIVNHITTDFLESTYLGQEVGEYISKIYGIDLDLKESKEAKKKYLLTLEKSSSDSQVGDIKPKRSRKQPSKNTK